MIGLLGATGAVGRHVVPLLLAKAGVPLRMGCRHSEKASRLVKAGLAEQVEVVDLEERSSLDAFVRECEVVVNCAGPSSQVALPVAEAALAAGCHVVDAGGSYAVLPFVAALALQAERTAVWYAGFMPGVSGLLLRLAASEVPGCKGVRVFHAVRDAYTSSGALDLLHDTSYSTAAGAEAAFVSLRASDDGKIASLLLSEGAVCQAAADFEGTRVSRMLGLTTFGSYRVLEEGHLSRALRAVHTLDETAAVALLCRASRADLFGVPPRVCLAVEAYGERGPEGPCCSVVLESQTVASLTAACVVLTTLEVLDHRLPIGAALAAEVLPPAAVAGVVRLLGRGSRLHQERAPLRALSLQEQGVL